jgi:hypothetical protein
MRRRNSIHARSRGMLFADISNEKSRAPKPGIWLMRGAQPATSAGARLFCRKPDSGALHHPAKSGEEINLELAVFELAA